MTDLQHLEEPLHPHRCGPCEDCREFLLDEARRRRRTAAPPTSNWDASGKRVHHIVHSADGGTSIPTLPLSPTALLKHAERFGGEGVLEAAEQELSVGELAAFKLELNKLATKGGRSKTGAGATTVQYSAQERAAIIGQLWCDGAPVSEIARRTGFSRPTIVKYVRQFEQGAAGKGAAPRKGAHKLALGAG